MWDNTYLELFTDMAIFQVYNLFGGIAPRFFRKYTKKTYETEIIYSIKSENSPKLTLNG